MTLAPMPFGLVLWSSEQEVRSLEPLSVDLDQRWMD